MQWKWGLSFYVIQPSCAYPWCRFETRFAFTETAQKPAWISNAVFYEMCRFSVAIYRFVYCSIPMRLSCGLACRCRKVNARCCRCEDRYRACHLSTARRYWLDMLQSLTKSILCSLCLFLAIHCTISLATAACTMSCASLQYEICYPIWLHCIIHLSPLFLQQAPTGGFTTAGYRLIFCFFQLIISMKSD